MSALAQRKSVRVLFDEYHSESWSISEARAREMQPEYPHNSSYQIAADTLAASDFTVHRNLDKPLLRDVLKQAIEHAEAEPGQVTAVNESMANVLYDRGNHQAAKELLCDERRYYEIFRTSAAPCTVRTQWSGDVALSPTAPARPEEARGR